LVFTPIANYNSHTKTLITSVDYFAPLGQYNGMLVNSDGEQILVHNLWGMGENVYLRV